MKPTEESRQHKRSVYLALVSLEEARARLLQGFDWEGLGRVEQVAVAEGLGRITAGPVTALRSAPAYHGAAMDGYAVRAESTFGASEEHPLRLAVGREAAPVNTGQALPEWANAVVMIEHVQEPEESVIEIEGAAFPWQHVRRVGEDVVAGELLLPSGHVLGPADLAALLTAGVYRVGVRGRPRVAILPTGSELVGWQEAEGVDLPPGAIVETNSVLLANLVRAAGGEPRVLPRQPDDLERLQAAIAEAVESDVDLVLVNAGASAGSRDFTVHAVRALGEVLVHGIQAMPGKPTLVGRVRSKPVVGTPGYPVSAWVCFDELVRLAMARLEGRRPATRARVAAVPARRLASRLGHEEIIRVQLGRVGDRVVAQPLKRGAGVITTMTRADGIVRVGPDCDGYEADTPVEAELLRSREELEDTLIVVGSHDITLDLLADRLPRTREGVRLSASNVGSLGGLIALREGRAHLGGTHLLDPETGEYNVADVRRALPSVPVRLVTLAHREQGLILRPGNPKEISRLEDLAREGVSFVNRQAGSGTRVLLDHRLRQVGLAPDAIRGYDEEEYTHMAVAVQVASGRADAGLGILAAARALGLDFVPVATERYDLCIPERFWDDPRVMALVALLSDDSFRAEVDALGGYHTEQMGRQAWPPTD